jgi:hypothetical protein
MTSVLSQDEIIDLDEKIQLLYDSNTATSDPDDPQAKKK